MKDFLRFKSFILKFAVLFFYSIININNINAQCNLDFTFTQSPGGLIQFTPVVTNQGIVNSCYWKFGDGNDSTINSLANINHTYAYNFNPHVCVQVNSTNCWDSFCKDITVNTALLNITCPGTAGFTYTANGMLTEFTSSIPGQQWYISNYGDGTASGGAQTGTFNHQYQINGTYQVKSFTYLAMSNGFAVPCDSFIQTVVVNNVPCIPDMHLSADTNSGAVYGYNNSLGSANTIWYIDGTVAATTKNLYSVLSNGTHSICMVISGPNSCYDSVCQSLTFNYPVYCSGVSFTKTPVAGQCDSYQFNVNGGSNILTSIDWMLDGVFLNSGSSFPLILTFSNSTYSRNVTCSVTANSSCIAADYFNIVNPASFYIMLDTTGAMNTWLAYPNSTGNISELWDFGDGTSSTMAFPTHVYSVAGYYNVCHTIVSSSGCNYSYCTNQFFYRNSSAASISDFIVVGTTGIQEHNSEIINNIYPNPASDNVTLSFNSTDQKNKSIVITDVVGTLIYEYTIADNILIYDLNTSGFSNGIYFITIKSNKTIMQTAKLMINKLY